MNYKSTRGKTITRNARACLALFKMRTLEAVEYRAAALASASISVFWALIMITVLTVFFTYAQNRGSAALSLPQTVTYVWLGQVFFALSPARIDGEILTKIQNGDVGVELCRPLDLYFHWFAKTVAGRLGDAWWRGALTLLAGCVFPVASMRMAPPASAAGFALFMLSVASMLLLSTSYTMLITSVRLGVTWGDGPTNVMLLLSTVLSGADLPLMLWPEFMQGFLFAQPFAGNLDLPVRLYVGAIEPGGAAPVFCLQLVWTLVFTVAGRSVMRGKLRKLIVQGG